MSPLRLNGSTSGYSQLDAPAVAGDQTFTLPGTGGTLVTSANAGKILQVVNATYSTQTNSSSSTYADTGLTATITPTLASSKILVIVHQNGCGKTSVGNTSLGLRVLRDATVITTFAINAAYTNSLVNNYIGSCSTKYLDSPATTSAITYKTQLASQANVSLVFVNLGSTTSTITLMEVAA